jgi:DoxX-like family
MSTAFVVVTILSAATLTFSVAADYFLRDQVLVNMGRAGVPTTWLPGLAALRAAGALGLLVGLAVPLIGAAAAAGVILYFALAIVTHLRAHWYSIGYPGFYLMLAAGSLVLGLAS